MMNISRQYDYDVMKKCRYELGMSDKTDPGMVERLMQNRFHPKNVGKFEEWGFRGPLSNISEKYEDEYNY